MRSIQVVTFDAMNTLIRLREPPAQTYARIGRSIGLPSSVDENELQTKLLHHFKAMSRERPCYGSATVASAGSNADDVQREWWYELLRRVFGEHYVGASTAQQTRLLETLYHHYETAEPWVAIDGGLNVLRRLKASGIRVGIVSNSDSRFRRVLPNVVGKDAARLIDAYFLSGELAIEKPDPAMFHRAVRLLNAFEPRYLLHIGDDYERDYLGASAAGCRSLLFVRDVDTNVVSDVSLASDPDSRNQFPQDVLFVRKLEDMFSIGL